MGHKFVLIVLVLLGLTGCVAYLPMPLQTGDVLQLAAQVGHGEATLARLEQTHQEWGTASSVDPTVTVARALDRQGNNNGYLDGAELITAIQAYATGQPIDGRAVDGRVLIGLIQLYAAWTPLGTQPGVEKALLELINQYRTQSGQCWDLLSDGWTPWPAGAVRSLSLSLELTKAALYHSQFMADHDCFAHQCPGEPDLQTRIEQAGYTGWTFIGENIAAGIEAPEEAFETWRNSPGHNRNILACQFKEIGIGRVYAPDSQYGWYWTTDFGSR